MLLSILVFASIEFLLWRRIDAIPATVGYASAANSSGASERPEPGTEAPLEEWEDEFQEALRRKFSILDLRPKDDCPNEGTFGVKMFYCPTPNPENVLEWQCVASDQLCNGIPDCPGAEDEDPTTCMFQLANQEQLRQLRKIIVRQSDILESYEQNSGVGQPLEQSDGSFSPARPASFPVRLARFRSS